MWLQRINCRSYLRSDRAGCASKSSPCQPKITSEARASRCCTPQSAGPALTTQDKHYQYAADHAIAATLAFACAARAAATPKAPWPLIQRLAGVHLHSCLTSCIDRVQALPLDPPRESAVALISECSACALRPPSTTQMRMRNCRFLPGIEFPLRRSAAFGMFGLCEGVRRSN